MNPKIELAPDSGAETDAPLMVRVADARPDKPLIADGLLEAGSSMFQHTENLIEKGLPRRLNPLAYTGALAAYTFFIAIITGVVLLFWYDSSVHSAYSSVQQMDAQWWGAGLIRTLHRYSSDACILFSIIHAFRVFVARKFTGARWMAWVTGVLLLGLIWLEGWLGYWLLWDVRGQAIADGSARALDVLPLFQEPISNSFLTNDGINSLIFFAVFYAHVLMPIPIGMLIWIHLMRLKKPKFLPKRGLMIACGVVLVAASIIVPAELASPADMAVYPSGFKMDWFYLVPLFLIERMDGVWFWVLILALPAMLSTLPFVMTRKKKPSAENNQDVCNGCTQCEQDCPYEAISMVSKEGKEKPVALVDPSRCTSCGICIGSCDPGAMRFESLERTETRNRIMGWLKLKDGPRVMLFLSADGAGRNVKFDRKTGLSKELPGVRIVSLPSAGWLHTSMIQLIAKLGGRSMLIIDSGSESRTRLSAEIVMARVEGTREPEFRQSDISDGNFRSIQLNPNQPKALKKAVAGFVEGDEPATGNLPDSNEPPLGRRIASGLITTLVLTAIMVLFSRFFYVAPERAPSTLIVSFKLAGQELTQEALEDTELDHLKGMKKRLELSPVRLKILVDGKVVHEEIYQPRGIRNNSASVGTVSFPMQVGEHTVRVLLSDTAEDGKWTFQTEQSIEFEKSHRRVVQFDEQHGFDWH